MPLRTTPKTGSGKKKQGKKPQKREEMAYCLGVARGPGTHWVSYRNIDGNFCEYFDSFGLSMPKEVRKYLSTSKKRIIYSSDEIQGRSSVLCGYWCLYYLLERQRGRSVVGVLHTDFNPNNQHENRDFLVWYFSVN